MELPKLNERKHESNLKQSELKLLLLKTIIKFEKDNNYEFLSYEVDNVLLDIVKRHHESYINQEFGFDTV